jgi:hypothetical protein
MKLAGFQQPRLRPATDANQPTPTDPTNRALLRPLVACTAPLLPHCSVRNLATLLPTLIKLGCPPTKEWRDAFLESAYAQLQPLGGDGGGSGGANPDATGSWAEEEEGLGGGSGSKGKGQPAGAPLPPLLPEAAAAAEAAASQAAAAAGLAPRDVAMLIWAVGRTDWYLHPWLLRALVGALATASPALTPHALGAAARGWAGIWKRVSGGAAWPEGEEAGADTAATAAATADDAGAAAARDAPSATSDGEGSGRRSAQPPSRRTQRRQLRRLHGWNDMWAGWLAASARALPHTAAPELCQAATSLAALKEVLPAGVLERWWREVWAGPPGKVVEGCTAGELGSLLWAVTAQPTVGWFGSDNWGQPTACVCQSVHRAACFEHVTEQHSSRLALTIPHTNPNQTRPRPAPGSASPCPTPAAWRPTAGCGPRPTTTGAWRRPATPWRPGGGWTGATRSCWRWRWGGTGAGTAAVARAASAVAAAARVSRSCLR